MTLYLWIRDLAKKYSFIKKVEVKNAIVYFYYDLNTVERYKKLPYRATRDQLVSMIENIKKEIDYESIKNNRDLRVKEALKNDEEKQKTCPFKFS